MPGARNGSTCNCAQLQTPDLAEHLRNRCGRRDATQRIRYNVNLVLERSIIDAGATTTNRTWIESEQSRCDGSRRR
jgi:hypothetical protein